MTRNRDERRTYERWPAAEAGELTVGTVTHPCRVRNCAAGGAQIAPLETVALATGDEVLLGLRGLPPLRAAVIWVDSEGIGLEFPDGPQYIFR